MQTFIVNFTSSVTSFAVPFDCVVTGFVGTATAGNGIGLGFGSPSSSAAGAASTTLTIDAPATVDQVISVETLQIPLKTGQIISSDGANVSVILQIPS